MKQLARDFESNYKLQKHMMQKKVAIKQLKLNSYEIIIVDDGSTDTTFLVAKEIQNNHTNIKIQKHSTNIGYGGAIKTGFKVATKNYVIKKLSDFVAFDIFIVSKRIYHS